MERVKENEKGRWRKKTRKKDRERKRGSKRKICNVRQEEDD